MPQPRAMSARMTGTVSVMFPPAQWVGGRVQPPPRSVYGREQTIDRGEARMQNSRWHAESDPEMALRAEVDARHDHRAVLANETVDQVHRVDRVLVAEEADRARGRRRPVQHARMAGGPILE